MKKNYEVKLCLDDFRSGRHAITMVFDIIEKVKAAVLAQSGMVKSFAYSNIPNMCDNPFGDIATLSFEVLTHDDDERELVVEHYAKSNQIGDQPEVWIMVSFRRSASTTEPLQTAHLDPGVGESRSVHVQSSVDRSRTPRTRADGYPVPSPRAG